MVAKMRKFMLTAAAILSGIAVFAETSTPSGFTDDLDQALDSAKESGKLVYVCFSGSDWCHWCIKLEQEVFSDETFADSLKDDFELVFIDSPSDTSRLSESAKVKNPTLTKTYKIRGFPTMVILDGKDGAEITRGSAYRSGGAAAYVDFLKEIRRDPGKPQRAAELEKRWIKPLRTAYAKLMGEINEACGKFLDEEMKKPENDGKSRESLVPTTMPIVKTYIPRFEALKKLAEKKAEEAPEEVKGAIKGFAENMGDIVERIKAN